MVGRRRLDDGIGNTRHRDKTPTTRECDLVRQIVALATQMIDVVREGASLVERPLEDRVRLRSSAVVDRLRARVCRGERLLQRPIEF